MELNKECICMVCNKPISTNDNGRVEWINKDVNEISDIHLCHDECSWGYNSSKLNIGDWIFSQMYGGPDYVYERLEEMGKNNPYQAAKINEIRKQLFE